MLKVDRGNKTFYQLDTPTLAEASILERSDLQEWIYNSSEAFFGEIGEKLFVLGKEVTPSQDVSDRIDLLAVDPEGTVVIVELKRGSNKLQMLQAVSYAGMVAKWGVDNFRDLLSQESWEELSEFLSVDTDELNRRQRLLLLAEGYDYALLAGAEWLSEGFGVDIRCCTVKLAKDPDTGTEYIAGAMVYPPPELVEQAVARGRGPRSSRGLKWADWDEALASIENLELRTFASEELKAGRENYLRRRGFHYRLEGKRRWSIQCRRKAAYVWQRGRFDGDEDFWKSRVSVPESVTPVKDGISLSFNLSTATDLRAFRTAVTGASAQFEWFPHGHVPGVDDDLED